MAPNGRFRNLASSLVLLATLVAAPLAARAHDADALVAPPPTPTVLAASPLIDFYTLTRPGADATQTLTLRLRADGIASLRTEYSIVETAAGTPVDSLFETGSWSDRNGVAAVHLNSIANLVGKIPTRPRFESIDLSFALTGCALKLVDDPAHAYGTAGLTFAKKSCGT